MRLLPFSRLEGFLAWRLIRGKRREGFISVVSIFSLLGILLGVATLIIVMSVMNGFRIELFNKLIGINGHIFAYTSSETESEPLQATLEARTDITFVQPVIQSQALATAGNRASGALVKGIDVDYLEQRVVLNSQLASQEQQLFNQGKSVALVGYRLARQLGIRVGEKVTLVSPEGAVAAFGSVPRLKSFTVIGTINSELYQVDSSYVFIPRQVAAKLFQRKRQYDYLELLTTNPTAAQQIADELADASAANIRFATWAQSNQAFFDALQVERNVMFIILSLVILVAAFNIISGQIMLVGDKAGNIALLRGMGMRKGAIMRIFFITGAYIGVIGTVLGIIIALLIATNLEAIRQFLNRMTNSNIFPSEIYYLSQLPVDLRLIDVSLVAIMALALTFLACIYPAWRAASTDPVEILRYG